MHRMPLSDELPYRFLPPRLNPTLVRMTRPIRDRMLRVEHWIEGIEFDGLDSLAGLLGRGDGVLICPNHCGRADGLVMLSMADRLRRPFCAMAAHQIFAGNAGVREWLLPRLGIFPVDREGSDLAAVKAATEVLAAAEHPLLVFPEGEVYYLADRLTPLREGVAFLASRARKALAERGKTVWIVPVGLKYRFVDRHDPLPSFLKRMEDLERRLLWWPRGDRPLVERVAGYAEASLALKELEYWGSSRTGPLRDRIAALRGRILADVAERRGGKAAVGSDPERIKELRRRCLEALAASTIAETDRSAIRRDLNDLYVAVQTLSYPGDYLFETPTLERVGETLMKLDEDVLMAGTGNPAAPLGPRRALARIGEPIDVGAVAARGGRPREALSAITTELERRIQGLLDGLGSGRPLSVGMASGQAEPVSARESSLG